MKIPNKTNSKLKNLSYVRQNIQSQPMIVKQELTFILSMAKKYTHYSGLYFSCYIL